MVAVSFVKAGWEQLAVVRLLVEAGADVNAVEHSPEDGYRHTALDCCSRQPEIAACLRSVGARSVRELDGPGQL